MITTVRVDLTWDNVSKDFCRQSEKKFKRVLKDMTGASDVDVIDWNSWAESEDDDWDE